LIELVVAALIPATAQTQFSLLLACWKLRLRKLISVCIWRLICVYIMLYGTVVMSSYWYGLLLISLD